MKNKSIKPLSGSEILLFLFFVLVSCCLWLMLTLNKEYETDIKFNVVVKEVPDNVTFSSKDAELVVRVRDRGTTLMNYKLGAFMPIAINYADFADRKGRLQMPVSQLRKRIKKQLQLSTTLLSCHPDTLVYYTEASAVKFPVALKGYFTPARQYAVGDVLVSPDSVWVFAPLQAVDSIKKIFTCESVRSELRDTLVFKLPLDVPESVSRCTPSEVTVTVPVYPYAQKSFKLPVQSVDFPDTYKLRTFPSQVQVMLNVSMDNYNKISAEDFEVGISYLDVFDAENNRVGVKLLRAPHYAKDVVIIPSEVGYIIEKQ